MDVNGSKFTIFFLPFLRDLGEMFNLEKKKVFDYLLNLIPHNKAMLLFKYKWPP